MNISQAQESDAGRDQPLAVSARKDLFIVKTGTHEHPLWTIKDPVSQEFFQFREHDFFVFSQLSKDRTVKEIQDRFFHVFAPVRLSDQQVLSFIQRLWMQGLVEIRRHGISSELVRRAHEKSRSEFRQRLASLLAIRFRGFNPDRVLERFLPAVRWFFHPLTIVVCALLMVLAIGLVGSQWDQVLRELPRLQNLFQSGNLIWFVVTLAGIKVLHELGHGFACKYFGGTCHEMGVMLLAFTPCLYCNVSDSWQLPNRWHRMAISAAGIYVELALAALCSMIWLWSKPGFVHSFCLYVMIIGSVSTLFLNGNPLLRYDGYYLLSDLVNIPNLRTRSQSVLKSWLTSMLYGIRVPDLHRSPIQVKLWLGFYGLLSGVYLWVVLLTILWMFYRAAEPIGIEVLVVILGGALISMRLIGITTSMISTGCALTQQGLVKPVRAWIGWTVMGLAVIGVLFLKVPRQISAPCLIVPRVSRPVYVSSPGRVELESLRPGQTVSTGERLAKLINRELELERLELDGQIQQQAKKIELLRRQQSTNPTASTNLPSAQARLTELQQRLEDLDDDLKRLTLTAPCDGVVTPGEFVDQSSDQETAFRAAESPLDIQNQGAWLAQGTVICRIADEQARDAIAFVEQSEIVRLAHGMEVEVQANQAGSNRMKGTIVEISTEPMTSVPPTILAERLVPVEFDRVEGVRPTSAFHEVRIRLSEEALGLRFDQTGQSIVRLPNETLLSKISRVVRKTLTVDFGA